MVTFGNNRYDFVPVKIGILGMEIVRNRKSMAKPEDYDDFLTTLTQAQPTPDWPEALTALWYDARGDWGASHDIAQEMHTDMGSWIHGYLHRKEGDEWNAGYWYRRAGKPFPKVSLEEELKGIVEFVVQNS
ncbi:hypothetical protein [Ulvibacterium marinum]|nr:hypothetical protein [Ulvibacterium marinum]